MPRLVIFLDIDDTILQTAPKCPPGEPVEPAAFNRAGEVLSFMTRAQRRLLEFWLEQGTVIPVTGRTDAALARVAIAFASWRITHHGAVVRQPDGTLPAAWRERIQPALVAAASVLRELFAGLSEGAATGGYRVHLHEIEDVPSYISAKADDDDAAHDATIAGLRMRLENMGLPSTLALHCNGNNLAVMVKGAQKEDAVRLVIAELERDGPLVTIGAGDSLTDLPFMRLCDFALTPRGSQIQHETWSGRP